MRDLHQGCRGKTSRTARETENTRGLRKSERIAGRQRPDLIGERNFAKVWAIKERERRKSETWTGAKITIVGKKKERLWGGVSKTGRKPEASQKRPGEES